MFDYFPLLCYNIATEGASEKEKGECTMNLGNKIRELRRSRNLTQEQLAVSLNISAQAVSKWEIGVSQT